MNYDRIIKKKQKNQLLIKYIYELKEIWNNIYITRCVIKLCIHFINKPFVYQYSLLIKKSVKVNTLGSERYSGIIFFKFPTANE
jgi:hypothetical protein